MIVISNLVGYLHDVQAVFQELNKVCHEHTKIIVNYYSKLWEPALSLAENIGLKTKGPQQNWLTQQDLNNLLVLAGFDVYKSNRRMILPLYVPILSPLFNRYIAKFPFFKSLCINHFSFAQPRLPYTNKDVEEKYSTTVVIPARNESGNIENAILRMPKFGKHIEIIFVEGNSKDDTWQTMRRTLVL